MDRLVRLSAPARCSACGEELAAGASAWRVDATGGAWCRPCREDPSGRRPVAVRPVQRSPIAAAGRRLR